MDDELRNCPYCGGLVLKKSKQCLHCLKAVTPVTEEEEKKIEQTVARSFNPFEAFTYMFTDKNFISKAVGLYIFNVICLLLSSGLQSASTVKTATPSIATIICGIIAIFLGFIPMGYYFSCVKSISTQEKTYELPTIKPFGDFITGALYMVASILLGLGFAGLGVILALILPTIIPAFMGVSTFLKIVCIVVLLIPVMKYIWFLFSISWIFAHKRYFTLFYKYGLGKKIIEKSKSTYSKGALSIVLIGILYGVAMILLGLICGFLFAGSMTMTNILLACPVTYFSFVFMYITAKMVNPECVKLLD